MKKVKHTMRKILKKENLFKILIAVSSILLILTSLAPLFFLR